MIGRELEARKMFQVVVVFLFPNKIFAIAALAMMLNDLLTGPPEQIEVRHHRVIIPDPTHLIEKRQILALGSDDDDG